jgi:hypothetical protein
MDAKLGKLAHVDPRKLWDSEPGAFTPWLASNIALLGEALGIDLELVQAEKAVGDFCCDIQAHDTVRDCPVIIENQLEQTDHRHLGQLLTYAAGLDAAVIVWISPEVREEHREVLDWLNRHTDDRVDFFERPSASTTRIRQCSFAWLHSPMLGLRRLQLAVAVKHPKRTYAVRSFSKVSSMN